MQPDELIIPAFIGCIGIALLTCARRWWIGRRLSVRSPSCAACRAPVLEAPTWSCPGCRADLRRVGILTPKLRVISPAGFFELSALWTCIVGVSFIAMLKAVSLAPHLTEQTLRRHHTLHSPEGLFNRLSVDSAVTERAGKQGDLSITLTVDDIRFSGSPLSATYGPRSGSSYLDTHGRPSVEPGELTQHVIRQWFESAGQSCDSPAKLAEVAELFSLVQDIRKDPGSAHVAMVHLHSKSQHQEVTTEPILICRVLMLAVPACIWLIGMAAIRTIVRNQRRNIQPAASDAIS